MSSSRFKIWSRGLGAVLIAFAALTAQAEDILTVVPDNALGVVVINRIAQTNDKVRGLALRLKVPPFDVLSTAKLTLGVQRGVDEKGSVAVAAVPSASDGAPVLVAFVAMNDPEALAEQTRAEVDADGTATVTLAGRKVVGAAKGNFAVLVEAANKTTLEAVLAATKSIAEASPGLTAWRAENEIYAVATPAGVKFAKQQIASGLQGAKAQLADAGEQGAAAIAGLSVYDDLVAAMDKEIDHAAIGLRLTDNGDLHVVTRTLPVPGGVLDGLTAKAKPSKGRLLAELPQQPYVFAGGVTLNPALTKAVVDWSSNVMRKLPGWDKLNDQQAKKLSRISLQSTQGLRAMSLVLGVPAAGDPLYSRMLMVAKTKDAAAYLDAYESGMAEMAKMSKHVKALFPSVKPERIELEGLSALKIPMNMSSFLEPAYRVDAEKITRALFGEGSDAAMYLIAIDQTTVLVGYASSASVVATAKAIREHKPSLVEDAAVAQTLAMLPSDAQWVGLISPRGGVSFASRLVATFSPEAAAEAQIPELPETPPVGLGALVSPSACDTYFVVPAAVLEAASAAIQKAALERGTPGT